MALVEIPVSVGTDDGQVAALGAGYPPAFSSATNAGTTDIPQKSLSGGNFDVRNMLIRFDTSVIPANATISLARLKLHATAHVDGVDNLNLIGEWYAASNWPIDITDGAITPGTTAFTRDIGAIVDGNVQIITLSNPDANVAKGPGALTGFRIGVDGPQPTVVNSVTISAFDHPTNQEPRLEITYTVPAGYEWFNNVWTQGRSGMRKIGQLAAVGTVANTTHASVACDEREGAIMVEFEVTAAGGAPSVTFKVQGSFDGPEVADAASDWADLELDPLDNTASAASFTKTAVGVSQYAVPPQDVPRKIRLVSSAISNITYEAEAYQ